MSRVYFHSPTRTAELRGSERAWLGGLTSDIAEGALHLRDPWRVDKLRTLIHPDHYMAKQPTDGHGWLNTWASSYSTAFAVGIDRGTPLVQYQGKPIEQFALALNTALVLGNDAVKLAARLHGACEIHAWVDGHNRAWLADIMQAGLDAGVYRRGFWFESSRSGERTWSDQGWGDVIALLREREDEPVVTSYSVCDQFPNSSVGSWMPPWPDGVERDWQALTEEQQEARSTRSDEWYELEEAEQWRISMEGLRASSGGLELRPENWDRFRFDHRLSVLDLFGEDSDERLRAAVADGELPERPVGSEENTP